MSRENARRSSCQSNLKQIGLGLMQYSQDYDEVFIADWYGSSVTVGPQDTLRPGNPAGVSYKWEDADFPYVKNEQVFTCPSATGKAAVPYVYYRDLPTASQPADTLGSYTIIHGYGANNATQTPPVSHPLVGDLVNLSRAEVPSSTAWVMDGLGTFFVDAGLSEVIDRHLDTINVLFLDGHVKAIKLSKLGEKNAAGTVKMLTLQDD